MSSSKGDKAIRLLVDGNVTIINLADGECSAAVIGDHGVYDIHRDRSGWYTCTCPAARFKHQCAHVDAVRSIIPDPKATEPEAGTDGASSWTGPRRRRDAGFRRDLPNGTQP